MILKNILFLLLFSLTLFGANAKDAAFMLGYNEVYTTALQKAKKEHKILMMVIVKEPCPYCDRLVDETLDTPTVKKRLPNFIPLIVAHDGNYPEDLRPPVTPVTNFINPNNGAVVQTLYGYQNVPAFSRAMDQVLQKYHK